eukprot:tig00001472_g8885.t1
MGNLPPVVPGERPRRWTPGRASDVLDDLETVLNAEDSGAGAGVSATPNCARCAELKRVLERGVRDFEKMQEEIETGTRLVKSMEEQLARLKAEVKSAREERDVERVRREELEEALREATAPPESAPDVFLCSAPEDRRDAALARATLALRKAGISVAETAGLRGVTAARSRLVLIAASAASLRNEDCVRLLARARARGQPVAPLFLEAPVAAMAGAEAGWRSSCRRRGGSCRCRRRGGPRRGPRRPRGRRTLPPRRRRRRPRPARPRPAPASLPAGPALLPGSSASQRELAAVYVLAADPAEAGAALDALRTVGLPARADPAPICGPDGRLHESTTVALQACKRVVLLVGRDTAASRAAKEAVAYATALGRSVHSLWLQPPPAASPPEAHWLASLAPLARPAWAPAGPASLPAAAARLAADADADEARPAEPPPPHPPSESPARLKAPQCPGPGLLVLPPPAAGGEDEDEGQARAALPGVFRSLHEALAACPQGAATARPSPPPRPPSLRSRGASPAPGPCSSPGGGGPALLLEADEPRGRTCPRRRAASCAAWSSGTAAGAGRAGAGRWCGRGGDVDAGGVRAGRRLVRRLAARRARRAPARPARLRGEEPDEDPRVCLRAVRCELRAACAPLDAAFDWLEECVASFGAHPIPGRGWSERVQASLLRMQSLAAAAASRGRPALPPSSPSPPRRGRRRRHSSSPACAASRPPKPVPASPAPDPLPPSPERRLRSQGEPLTLRVAPAGACGASPAGEGPLAASLAEAARLAADGDRILLLPGRHPVAPGRVRLPALAGLEGAGAAVPGAPALLAALSLGPLPPPPPAPPRPRALLRLAGGPWRAADCTFDAGPAAPGPGAAALLWLQEGASLRAEACTLRASGAAGSSSAPPPPPPSPAGRLRGEGACTSHGVALSEDRPPAGIDPALIPPAAPAEAAAGAVGAESPSRTEPPAGPASPGLAPAAATPRETPRRTPRASEDVLEDLR